MKARWAPRNKYGARKVTVDGITFDSAKEAKRWKELQLMERAGQIRDLRRQVPFELIPVQHGGIRNERPVTYIADFVYIWPANADPAERIIEDVKGYRTPEYKIKRKLMKMKGYEITEV